MESNNNAEDLSEERKKAILLCEKIYADSVAKNQELELAADLADREVINTRIKILETKNSTNEGISVISDVIIPILFELVPFSKIFKWSFSRMVYYSILSGTALTNKNSKKLLINALTGLKQKVSLEDAKAILNLSELVKSVSSKASEIVEPVVKSNVKKIVTNSINGIETQKNNSKAPQSSSPIFGSIKEWIANRNKILYLAKTEIINDLLLNKKMTKENFEEYIDVLLHMNNVPNEEEEKESNDFDFLQRNLEALIWVSIYKFKIKTQKIVEYDYIFIENQFRPVTINPRVVDSIETVTDAPDKLINYLLNRLFVPKNSRIFSGDYLKYAPNPITYEEVVNIVKIMGISEKRKNDITIIMFEDLHNLQENMIAKYEDFISKAEVK